MYLELLNYGAAAQTYFSYNESNLVNANVSEDQKTFAIPEVTQVKEVLVKGTGYVGSTMALNSEMQLLFVISQSAVQNATRVEITFRDHRNKEDSEKCIEILRDDFEKYLTTSNWQYTVKGLAIADGDTVVTCTVYGVDNEVLSKSIDSINHYAFRQRGKSDLYPMLLRFTQAAYNYFH